MINEIHEEFIDKSTYIVKTVTDNGANMVKAFQEKILQPNVDVNKNMPTDNGLKQLLQDDSLKNVIEICKI